MNKILIIGGVAAGAGCAARLRRLDESADIVLIERGEYISYANCGLPYHVGGVIESASSRQAPRRSDLPSPASILPASSLSGLSRTPTTSAA